MALNYYVPAQMTSADLLQAHPTDVSETPTAPDTSAERAPSDHIVNQSAQLLENLLLQEKREITVSCISIARPTDPIIGRSEVLAEIFDRLLGSTPSRLALDGPHGVGKTRLALEVAYDERIQQRFSGGILMMGLGQHPDVEMHLRGWTAALGLEHDPRLSIIEQVERIIARIEIRGEPCLLIVDDVWKAEHGAFQLDSALTSVLFTGRQREPGDFAMLVSEQDLLSIPPLDQAAAVDLLYQRTGWPTPERDAELGALADLVGGMPLVLSLLGGYLRQKQSTNTDWFNQTLDDLTQAAQRSKLPTEPIEQTRRNFQESLIARLRYRPVTQTLNPRVVVELGVAALRHNAREAFVRLAALPPDPLSFGVEIAEAVADADAHMLYTFTQHALLDPVGEGRYRMHRVLADWASQRYYADVEAAQRKLAAWHIDLLKTASADDLAEWRGHADNWQPLLQLWHKATADADQLRSAMQNILPQLIDYGYWNDALAGLDYAITMHQRERPMASLARYYAGLLHYRRADFAQAQSYTVEALEGFQEAQQVRSQVMALNLLGHIQKAAGNYTAARDSYETARSLTPETEARAYAACLTNLALLLQAQGDYAAARPLYNHALTLCEQSLDPTHPDIAASLANLASLLYDQGHYTAARPLCERALAIHEQALGPTHPHTATSLTSLARLLQAQGDYQHARPLYERALTIYEQALGPTHPDTATSLANMAVLLHDQGDYEHARQLYERALAIHEQVLGPDHADTATSLANLASLLQDQGDYAAARPIYERALAIHQKTPGPDHPDTASSLINLASLLQIQGDYAAARPLYERALTIHEQALGPNHPHTASSLTSLARLLQTQGDYTAARPLYERALAIREQRLGPQHPGTADSLGNLAGLLREQGDYAAARPLYERALAIHEQILGAEHPSVAVSLTNLAYALQAQGDYTAARPLYERALAIREQTLGPQHPDTVTSINNLALLLQAQGDYVNARALYKRVLDTRMRIFGSQHPQTATSIMNLGSLLQAQGDYQHARTLYEHALTIQEQVLGPQHPDTATSMNNLALLNKAEGNLMAARQLYERALHIRTQILGTQHPDTATSMNNLASLLYELGDLSAARPLCEHALSIRARALGAHHPHTIASMTNLALLYRDLGQLGDAAHLLKRAIVLREATYGQEHASTKRLHKILEQLEQRIAQLSS